MHVKGGWLRQLIQLLGFTPKAVSLKQKRRALLENLEARYALTGAPTAMDDFFSTSQEKDINLYTPPQFGVFLGIVGNDTDPDGDALRPIFFSDPPNGTIVEVSGAYRYVPNDDFVGTDTFNYRATDDVFNSEPATVTVVVSGPNAKDDSYIAGVGGFLSVDTAHGVLANDNPNIPTLSDAEAVLEEGPLHGSIVLNTDGSFNYTPNGSFTGSDVFTYRVTDDGPAGNVASVFILGTGIANAGESYFIEEGSDSLVLDGSQSGGAGLTYRWTINANADHFDPNDANSGFTPDLSQAISSGSSPTLALSWATLNSLGIVDGEPIGANAYGPVVILEVTDTLNQNQKSYSIAAFNVSNVAPLLTQFLVTPQVGTCDGLTFDVYAEFTEVNPFDADFAATIQGDFLGGSSSIPLDVTYASGVYVVTGSYSYAEQGSYFALLTIDTLGFNGIDPIDAIISTIFVDATAGGGDVTIDGEPATPLEGTEISLGSTVTEGCGGTPVTAAVYEWSVLKVDADGNSSVFTPGSGDTISFTPDDDGTYTVSLIADGVAAESRTFLVGNVPPTVDSISGPSAGVRNQTLTYQSSFNDVAGDGDAETTWTVLDSASSVVAVGSGTSFDFTPTDNVSYSVHFTVNDLDGGVTYAAPVSVSVSATLVQSGVLYVGGTSSNDTFVFTQTGAGQYSLVLNGASPLNFTSITQVQLFGGAGTADAVTVSGDSGTNSFEIHTDRLTLDSTPFLHSGIELRTLNAMGSGDLVTVLGGSATVNGGASSDTLVFAGGTNDWQITSNNEGTINAGQIAFTSIEHLVGGSGNDTFRFENGVGVSGDVEGGGGMDTLDYSACSSSNPVNINLQSGSASRTGGISSIESVIGGAGSDTLTAANTVNNWLLFGDSGSINGAIAFASFENLKGGNQVDTFGIQTDTSTTGYINGNGGADVLSYSAFGSGVTVNLATSTATAVGSFSSIDTFIGGSASDTLVGKNSNNTWNITGVGSGIVGSVNFSSFESLQGGSANDTFRVNEGVSQSGISIAGGNTLGIDKLDYAAFSSGTSVNVNLASGTATGFLNVSGIENVAGGGGNDVIRGDGGNNMLAGNQGNDIILGGGGNDVINGNAGRDILIGCAGADVILGNADEDLLIAGTTDHDDVQSALNAILAEWSSSASYATRTGHILGTISGGLNGAVLLNGNSGAGQTVFNDSEVDTLTGNGGVDWYFANQDGVLGVDLDIVTDKAAAELWSDTDFLA